MFLLYIQNTVGIFPKIMAPCAKLPQWLQTRPLFSTMWLLIFFYLLSVLTYKKCERRRTKIDCWVDGSSIPERKKPSCDGKPAFANLYPINQLPLVKFTDCKRHLTINQKPHPSLMQMYHFGTICMEPQCRVLFCTLSLVIKLIRWVRQFFEWCWKI